MSPCHRDTYDNSFGLSAQRLAALWVRHARLHREWIHSSNNRHETDHVTLQGRPFAWQEAQIALVTIMQRFDLVMHDPTYELELKQTLTIKPHNFYIHALPRKDKPRLLAIPSSVLLSGNSAPERAPSSTTVAGDATSLHPLYVLYGSNTGSSEAFAQRLASAAASHGEWLAHPARPVAIIPAQDSVPLWAPWTR